MREVTTLAEVVEILREVSAKRIGIDGADGVGKTTLARDIAKSIGFTHLNLDDFLEKNQGGFVHFIKYDDLRAKAAQPTFVVEGVCLLEVLARARITIDALVYVKRYHLGYWPDECELEIAGPLEAFLSRERELLARISEQADQGNLDLGEEIIRYHYEHRPHTKATLIYRRNDDR